MNKNGTKTTTPPKEKNKFQSYTFRLTNSEQHASFHPKCMLYVLYIPIYMYIIMNGCCVPEC